MIRDVGYGEDASQIRTGSGPKIMATLRNLAINILKITGHTSVAAACRHHARTLPGPSALSDSAQHETRRT